MHNSEILKQLQDVRIDEPWFGFHPRVWDHPGVIVDLGCLGWDWSKPFIGKKPVYGADPEEAQGNLEGTKLFRGFVGTAEGTVSFSELVPRARVSAFCPGSGKAQQTSYDNFLSMFSIDSVAILKMNIEGSEYGLIRALSDDKLPDQIIVAFHDYPAASYLGFSQWHTNDAIGKLSQWYDYCILSEEWRWFLFLRRLG